MTRQQAGVSAEAVAKLVAKWNEASDQARNKIVALMFEGCARELKAALHEEGQAGVSAEGWIYAKVEHVTEDGLIVARHWRPLECAPLNALVTKWRSEAETGSLSDAAHALERCAKELNAALATAPPEQAAQQQPCDCEQLCERLTNPLPPGRFCMHEAAQEKMRAEPPQAGGQPQAVSAGALSALQEQFTRTLVNNNTLEQLLLCNWTKDTAHNPVHGLNINGLVNSLVDLLSESLVAHDQKVRAEARADALQEAIGLARLTPFRAHAADDIDFHSGCEQTRERIVGALRKLASGAEEK